MLRFQTLGDFARYLEQVGELHRVGLEVDPALEIAAIATRALRERKQALLFERVTGSPYPVLVNALASDFRCELALQKHPAQLGEELIAFLGDIFPPKLSSVLRHRALARRFLSTPVRMVSRGRGQEVIEEPNLDTLPVLTCWPDDGGRFITLPQVVTEDPRTGKRNMGMYRMHVFDRATTGMHWQIQKGGGFHFSQAEKMGRPLELAVAIGTDPALLLATIAALPENIDEAMFAGFLRGARTEFTKARSLSIAVPAHAEFILEGVVNPRERRMEGPFGDHFGHYSHAAEFPVFHLSKITHRRDAIYPATVVGIPPMEDKFLGDATQQILGPLAKLVHAEITDLWAYYEAGFHNLLVVAVDQRYAKEAMKTALGLMGLSQLALTKCIVLVSEGVNVRSFDDVMKEVRDHFDPHFDFVMIPRVPLDTLDFTSFTMNLGSKMILDATRKARPADGRIQRRGKSPGERARKALRGKDRRIVDVHLVHDTLLLVKVTGGGMAVLKKLVRAPELQNVALVAAVSEDVDIRERESYVWGVFTRFDCERDIVFTDQSLMGISPIYGGVMGIDATWKRGYPEALTMTEAIRTKVDERWSQYWK
jgi:4-hydroxy-3-polyprenylbenzoate decarboxylase